MFVVYLLVWLSKRGLGVTNVPNEFPSITFKMINSLGRAERKRGRRDKVRDRKEGIRVRKK